MESPSSLVRNIDRWIAQSARSRSATGNAKAWIKINYNMFFNVDSSYEISRVRASLRRHPITKGPDWIFVLPIKNITIIMYLKENMKNH
jgi:hypothetical protein